MSMTEEITDAPKPKSPKKKRAKRTVRAKPAVVKEKSADRYAGMTVKECCAACNADACVISGKPYCAHPRKGGLHPSEMSDGAALARRKEAEQKLRNQLLTAS